MLYKFIGLFGIVILWLFCVMCDVIPGYACFVLRCYALLRLDKKLFILPVYVLRTFFSVVMPICCVMPHSTLQYSLFSWYDVITFKSKQIIRCALSGAFSKIS